MTGLGGYRVADLPEQLVGLLVHAHHRSAGIVRPGLDAAETARTSSMRAANSALACGGIVQHFFR